MYSETHAKLKRGLDIAASGAGLAAFCPLLVGLACAVRLTSPGPALFRQARVGRGGRTFELVKFRTMRQEPGAQITAQGDPRITRLGRWLRRSKLDELPQLLNVLRGDLSLVGPRPEVPKYVDLYPQADREFLFRFRPGITDPTTIELRNEEQILAAAPDPERTYREELLPRKIRGYRSYLERATFWSDLRVLGDTLLVIARPSRAQTTG